MKQELRNKIYGIIGAVLTVLFITGVVDDVQRQEALNLAQTLLDNIDALVGLVGAVIAFVKSLPSKTVTLDVPKADVVSINTAQGSTVPVPAKHAA